MDTWRAYRATPWGRLRFAVVAHTLATTIAREGGGVWRILDVGGADGGDAIPLAAAGHNVTVLDPSGPMLEGLKADSEKAGVGVSITAHQGDILSIADLGQPSFDLVLCHLVLQYLDDLEGQLARLLGAVRPGGFLSVMAPNRPGEVLAKLARGVDPAGAFALLDSDSGFTQTFDQPVLRIDAEDAIAVLESLGCRTIARFGVRCVNDLLPDSAPKSDPDFFAALLRLELAVCDREPYLRNGMAWQVVVRR